MSLPYASHMPPNTLAGGRPPPAAAAREPARTRPHSRCAGFWPPAAAELRAACKLERKTGKAVPSRLTTTQQEVITRLVQKHGDNIHVGPPAGWYGSWGARRMGREAAAVLHVCMLPAGMCRMRRVLLTYMRLPCYGLRFCMPAACSSWLQHAAGGSALL